jgi:hypothetical protein
MIQAIRSELALLNTEQKELRNFGFLMGGVLSIVCGIILWKRGLPPTTLAIVMAIGASAFLLIGATLPRALRPVYILWMALAIVLGFIMTRVILTLVFFLVVTPIGLVMRMIGKDPLTKGADPSADTYWIPRTYPTKNPSRLLKYY